MPILGIIASQNYTRITSSYESIATTTVGSGGSATISFTSIPSTYKHLQIRVFAKAGVANGNLGIQFNSDTGANYAFHQIYGTGAATGGTGTPNGTFGWANQFLSTPNFSASIIDIVDYTSTSKNKTVKSFNGVEENGSGYVQLRSSLWANTSAITSISLFNTDSSSFQQYSSFALYGIKG